METVGRTPLWTLAQTDPFFDLIVRAYSRRARGRKSTLVFCATVGAAKAMTDCFVTANIPAQCVSQETPHALRRQIIEEFKAGKFPVLVNCKIFTEGADIPGVCGVEEDCYLADEVD